MAFYQKILNALRLPSYKDEEQNRIAAITHVIALVAFCGMCIIIAERLLLGMVQLVLPISVAIGITAIALILNRRGFPRLAGSILLWGLLGFCSYLILKNDGFHDTAVLIIPGVLVIAGAILARRYFIVYSTASLSLIGLIGYFEVVGIIHNDFSSKTNITDIVDVIIILAITAVTVRLLADALVKMFSRALTNERRYRLLFEGANDAIFIMKRDQIVECNEMALNIFGCTGRTDLLGHTPWEYSPKLQPDGADSKGKALSIIQSVSEGYSSRFQWKHQRKDGAHFDAEVSLNILELRNERLIQAIVRDVTERKEMENRLRESEEFFRTLIETSPDAIVNIDTRGMLSFVSAKARSMFHVPSDVQVIGTPFIDWVASEDREEMQRRFSEVVLNQTLPSKRAFRFLKYDRTQFCGELMSSPVVDAQGKFTGLLTICRDITDRRAAEEALRSSEEKFSKAFHASSVPFWILRLKDRKFVEVSESLEKLTGFSREEMIGHTSQELGIISDLRRQEELYALMRSDGKINDLEYEIRRKDGAIIICSVTATLIEIEGELYALGSIFDLTQRKLAEEQIRLLAHAIRSVSECISITDINDRIIFVNEAFQNTYGYSEGDLRGKNIDIVRSPNNDPEILQTIRSSTIAGKWQGEVMNRRKDGSEFPVYLSSSSVRDDDGNIVALMGVASDITERKLAELTKKKSEEEILSWRNRYEIVAKVSGQVVYDYDLASGKIQWGGNIEEVLGYTKEEMGNISMWEQLIHPDDRADAINELNAAMAKSGIYDVEYRFQHKDGHYVIMLDKGKFISDKSNFVRTMVGMMQDISDRKKAEEALRKLSRAVEQSPASIVITNTAGQIEYVNPKFLDQTGYTLDEVIGRNPRILKSGITPDGEYIRLWNTITAGREWEGEFCNKKKNGEFYWQIASISPIIDSEGSITHFIAVNEDITERKRDEEILKNSRDQLRTLAAKLDNIREEERKHIAREIHDQLGQILTGLKMNISWLMKKVTLEQSIKSKFDYTIELIDMAIQSVRKIATDLRPGVLDELGLGAAIEWQTREFERQSGISCQCTIQKHPLLTGQEFSIAAFRIFQEALTNILRHAEASSVSVNLAVEQNLFYLQIEDDGKGIEEKNLHDPKSIGILGMKERALPFGGVVTVSRAGQKGTRVNLQFPLKSHD